MGSQNKNIQKIEKMIGKSLSKTDNIHVIAQGIQYDNGKVIGLSLNHCNLTEVPDPIENLKNLEYLSLSFNKIKELPDWMDELENLKELILTENNINTLPRYIGKYQYLEVFHILKNPIDRLPMSFRRYADIYSKFRELGIKRYGLNSHTIETIQMLRNRGVRIVEPKN